MTRLQISARSISDPSMPMPSRPWLIRLANQSGLLFRQTFAGFEETEEGRP